MLHFGKELSLRQTLEGLAAAAIREAEAGGPGRAPAGRPETERAADDAR